MKQNEATNGIEKIAIIGGGPSAISSALALTQEKDWQQKRQVTLYQMGWRLGGKCASGRNAENGQRIEEHGVHILFGFYENTFKQIRDVYGELSAQEIYPFKDWQDAFQQHNLVGLYEQIDNNNLVWEIDFAQKPGLPGDGNNESLTIHNMFQSMLAWLRKFLSQLEHELFNTPLVSAPAQQHHHLLAEKIAAFIEKDIALPAENWLSPLFKSIDESIEHLAAQHRNNALPSTLDDIFEPIIRWLEDEMLEFINSHTDIRRLFILIDFMFTLSKGVIADEVLIKGWDCINEHEMRAWLSEHGASEILLQSALITACYDLVFAFENGDYNKPNVEAGTMLRAALRIALSYQGSLMWKFRAGTADIVFAPAYKALIKRGVKIEFFHKTENLHIDPETACISSITMTQQVALAKAGLYNPLVDVKGLSSWPSQPKLNEIEPQQAKLLQQFDINLESNWSNWAEVYQQHFNKNLPQLTLKQGEDFDKVVLAASIDSAKQFFDQDISTLSPALAKLFNEVKTTPTQAYQLWLQKSPEQLSENAPWHGNPVLTSFCQPIDTWAVMDQVITHEDWPADSANLKNISYFCGPLKVESYPPSTDTDFPEREKAKVKQHVLTQLNQQIGRLWPVSQDDTGFKWKLLFNPAFNHKTGAERLDGQYWRANIDPSERYVLSLTNSTQYRLNSDESGFNNLYLAGDWIKTGLNIGCFEAATMSGMQASRAICGYPENINGESDF